MRRLCPSRSPRPGGNGCGGPRQRGAYRCPRSSPRVPFPFLWALWVALVDFLPLIGGALAGIPVVLFAAAHSLTAGIVTLVVFLIYTQIENHALNPVVMSRTVKVNPLLVLISILVRASIGGWVGGIFGAFVAARRSPRGLGKRGGAAIHSTAAVYPPRRSLIHRLSTVSCA